MTRTVERVSQSRMTLPLARTVRPGTVPSIIPAQSRCSKFICSSERKASGVLTRRRERRGWAQATLSAERATSSAVLVDVHTTSTVGGRSRRVPVRRGARCTRTENTVGSEEGALSDVTRIGRLCTLSWCGAVTTGWAKQRKACVSSLSSTGEGSMWRSALAHARV